MYLVESFQKASSFAGDTINNVLKGIARRQLESDLAAIIKTVAGHKANGVRPGSQDYVNLYTIALQKIDSFCKKHEVSFSSVASQLPAVEGLRQLAYPKPGLPKVVTGLIVFALTSIGIFLLGIVFEAANWLFTTGYNLVAR